MLADFKAQNFHSRSMRSDTRDCWPNLKAISSTTSSATLAHHLCRLAGSALWAENTDPWDKKKFACALEQCNLSIQVHFYLLMTKIYGFVPVLSHLRSEFGSQSSLVRGSLLRQEFIFHISIIILQNKNSGVFKHPIRKRLSSGLNGYMKEICCDFGANR